MGFPFFFFQAEDGIRDRNVTGVQTCALPISLGPALKTYIFSMLALAATFVFTGIGYAQQTAPVNAHPASRRSEERRVGKECRSRWWPHQSKETSKDLACPLDRDIDASPP